MMRISIFFSLFVALPAQSALLQNYVEVQQQLQELATRSPKVVQIFDLATNDTGELIQGVRIGSGAVHNLVVGTHHGNEYGSSEVALAVAKSLANSPLAEQTVFVIPVLNTSGFDHRARAEQSRGVAHDPNRDYPGPCATEGPFTLKSTKALADFIEKEKIVASATLHTHYPGVVYPWGFSTKDLNTPYLDLFRELTAFATQESKYKIGNSAELIYPADGTFEDYAFWRHGIWSILFELGFSHSPTESEVATMIEQNVPGIRRLLEKSPTSRALDHEFHGRCDLTLRSLDRHDE